MDDDMLQRIEYEDSANEDVFLLEDDNLIDEVVIKHSVKDIKLGDVILIQFFLCLILVLALVAVNVINSEQADKLFGDIKDSINSPIEIGGDFLNYIKGVVDKLNA